MTDTDVMTRERPTPRLPWGLVGAVLAALAVESAIGRRELELARPELYDWRLARQAAQPGGPALRADVLGFGTSMTQLALLPQVIERRTGRPAYNLAVCAGRAHFAYFYLRNALAAGATPSAVLLDVHPMFIAGRYQDNPTGWTDALSTFDLFEMALDRRDPAFFHRYALPKVLPSLAFRYTLRDRITAAVVGDPVVPADEARFENLQHIRNVTRNLGSFVTGHNAAYHGEIDKYRDLWLGDPPTPLCDPVEELYLRRFLSLAQSHGMAVYWLITPVVPELRRERLALGRDAAYDAFTRRILADYPGVTVVDGRDSGFPADVFLDACHLDPKGARAFSQGVSEVLTRADKPRRVALPGYQEPPSDVPIETITESAAVVRDQQTRR